MHIVTIDSKEKSILYQIASPVPLPLSPDMIDKIEAMRAYYKTFGDKAGFAAPQVGLSDRIILVESDLYNGQPSTEPIILINPTWEALDQSKALDIEGCISVPGKSGVVERFLNVRLTAQMYDHKTQTTTSIQRDYHNEFSCCLWQHEIDHLDGQVYVDKAKIVLAKEEMDLILQYLFETQQLNNDATVFDMGPLVLELGRKYQQQRKSLMDFLMGITIN